jgi:hypothetical protein
LTDEPKSDPAATPRPDRLSAGLVATLAEHGPSAAAVELYEIVADRVRQLRDAGHSSGDVVKDLRAVTRQALAPLATTFALERTAQLIIGDVTRWCLHEYFRPRRELPRPDDGSGVKR